MLLFVVVVVFLLLVPGEGKADAATDASYLLRMQRLRRAQLIDRWRTGEFWAPLVERDL